MILQEVNYYPEHQNEPYPGQDVRDYVEYDPDNGDEYMGNKTYIRPLTSNGIYYVDPIEPKLAMGQVIFDVRVPTNLVPYEDGEIEVEEPEQPGEPQPQYDIEGAIVRLTEQGVITTPTIIQNLQGQIERTQVSINNIAQVVAKIEENTYQIEKMDVDFTVVNSEINQVVNNLYTKIKADFNNITNIYNTTLANVNITNEFKEEITVNMEQKIKKITEINVNNIVQSLNVVSNNQNILVSDISLIKNFLIKMYGKNFVQDPTGSWKVTLDTPQSKRKCIEASSSKQSPTPMDTNLLEGPSGNNNDNNNNNDKNISQFQPLMKKMRGPNDQDISDPVRQSYYWNDIIKVDNMNEKYNKDYYGLFEVQHITEVPMLDTVYIKITENTPDFVWDINTNYINTNKNNMENDPAGYNPLGVRQFHVEIAVDTNKLKEMNEIMTINRNNQYFDIAVYNTALVKYSSNNQIEPQEVINRNLRADGPPEDPYEGNGKTIYDNGEKIFINSHKYTINEENENCDEEFEGFKKVMQTTIVPIMDHITLPEITSNKTLRYSIQDFNNIYSLSPGSENRYRNDFIGFNTIDIPVKVNNKVVPLLATQDGIYTPSMIDPTAIGFSSVQVSTTTRSSGGGSGGDSGSGSVNNLQNYIFRGNTVYPYTIREYNNTQYPPMDYTGFDAIIVDTNNDLEILDIDVNKLGKYSLAYGNVENIMPVMNANTTDDIILSGTPQWNSSNLTWYRLFDGNTTGENGFHSSSSISEGYLKIQFLNEKKSFNYFNCFAYSGYPGRAPTHIVVEGSDDDDDYVELFNGNINYVNLQSLQNVLVNTGEYYYYKFTFSYLDGKSDYIEFTELQLMKYSIGGYKGVNVNVDLPNVLLSETVNVDNIENNRQNSYYVFDSLDSFVPLMSNNQDNGASIIDIINGYQWYPPYNLFDNNNDSAYEVTGGYTSGGFILVLDSPEILKSYYLLFKSSDINHTLGYFKIFGSNDGLTFVKLYEIEDGYDNSVNYSYDRNYLYKNVYNDDAYSYYKFEFGKHSGTDWMYCYTLKLFNVPVYFGFDKLTIVNNTYSKTSDPVVSNLDPNNQRVYVNTDNSDIHPYVRRNWMTVPLEEKIITYDGNYVPGLISTSSGYYGIKSIKFISNNETSLCTSLIENQNDNTNQINSNKMVIGDYTITCDNGINNGNNFWRLFDYENWSVNYEYAWINDESNAITIEKTYPFVINCIVYRRRITPTDMTNNAYLYGTIDGVNWINILSLLDYRDNDYVYDSNHIKLKFNNDLKYLKYKFWVNGNTNNWNYMERIMFDYCTDGTIDERSVTFPILKVNLDQPGTYYYDPPIGYNNIGSVIVNYSTGDPVIVNKTITSDGNYIILPPQGNNIINSVNLTVSVINNAKVYYTNNPNISKSDMVNSLDGYIVVNLDPNNSNYNTDGISIDELNSLINNNKNDPSSNFYNLDGNFTGIDKTIIDIIDLPDNGDIEIDDNGNIVVNLAGEIRGFINNGNNVSYLLNEFIFSPRSEFNLYFNTPFVKGPAKLLGNYTIPSGNQNGYVSLWYENDSSVIIHALEYNNKRSTNFTFNFYLVGTSFKFNLIKWYGNYSGIDTYSFNGLTDVNGSYLSIPGVFLSGNDIILNDGDGIVSIIASGNNVYCVDSNNNLIKTVNLNTMYKTIPDVPYNVIRYVSGDRYTPMFLSNLSNGPIRVTVDEEKYNNGNADLMFTTRTNYWAYYYDKENKILKYKHYFFNVYIPGPEEDPDFVVPSGWKYAKSAIDNPGYNQYGVLYGKNRNGIFTPVVGDNNLEEYYIQFV